jgi:hypothetical protein
MSYVTDLPGYTSDNSGATINLFGGKGQYADRGVFQPNRGFRVEDWWSIDASDLTRFLDVCGGITEYWGSVFYPRMIPLRHRLYPFALCTAAEFELYTTERADGVRSKDRARVHVTYEAPTYPIDGTEAFLSYRKAPGQRYLPLTGATAGSGTFAEDPYKPNTTSNLYFTLHRLTTDPSSTWDAYNGYTNSDVWRGAAAGTVLFHGAQVEQEARIGGFQTYQAAAHFEFSPIGWNSWVNSAGAVTTVTYNSGTSPAPTTSFASLFGF